jgi:glycosyltransferase involved in cell wall biosynthesis
MIDRTPRTPHIAIFASFSGQGGVERMIVNLCQGLVEMGCCLDLVLVKSRSAHLEHLPQNVRVFQLKAKHTLSSFLELAGYLRRERPDAMLAAKDRAGKVAVFARKLAGVDMRLVFRIGTTVSAALVGGNLLRRLAWFLPMRLIYPRADAIVAVSQGVAADLGKITGLDNGRIIVIENPVVTPRLATMASETLDDPWFAHQSVPLVFGMGRLTRQKDFPSLLRAFAKVRAERPCKLVILGEGGDRGKLERLARELGIDEDFYLPGFAPNPYKYLRRADLFVLSSAWEGSPNVLTEALALGIPVVATDCPSGPREVLDGGKFGPLVRVGDVDGLAEAMRQVLDHPPEAEFLKKTVENYTVEKSSRRYLSILMKSEPIIE